jgi:hypothetical protein
MKTVKTRIGGRSEVEVVSKEERLGCSLFRLLRRAACRPGRGSPRVALGVIDDPFLNRQDAMELDVSFLSWNSKGGATGEMEESNPKGRRTLGPFGPAIAFFSASAASRVISPTRVMHRRLISSGVRDLRNQSNLRDK